MKKIKLETSELIKKLCPEFKLSSEELNKIEVVDFGLNDVRKEGVQIITLQEAQKFWVRLLILLPNQTEPEHWHPPFEDSVGKEEYLRIIGGTMRVYTEGENTLKQGFIVENKDEFYTALHENIFTTGEQIFFEPGKDGKHWFQGGLEGAVALCLTGKTKDKADLFTDPNINR